ncbi:SDR family NAD(P)-dependent oxidoreductase [Variovorax sp. JS1663]|uniref:SDR family NAD(P)-dependent oxidoreductase n=1 Tax=Variovorax sp. JS1663 TaxID=1851577 RepID=UPI000B342F1D|nr:SDR family oxidoreductase [Variovorax sp. JS1663]OUM02206.1 SDR family oxidoreductase [Variovorax sp. JS1663]
MTPSSTPLGTALITGASSGIGAIYADRLARRGHDLVLVARNRERLQALADRLGTQTGRRVETLVADLTHPHDVARVEERLRSDERITMLVNNAGLGATAPLVDSDIDKMEAMLALNVNTLTRLTYAAVPVFLKRPGASIVNIASIVAISPETLNGVYGASKAYVLALGHSLQHELAGRGVRIQTVLPGATATEFWDIAGVPVSHLPSEIVMTADDLVDAALTGFDRGETVTIPSLQDAADWEAYEGARRAMSGRLSSAKVAPRYAAG